MKSKEKEMSERELMSKTRTKCNNRRINEFVLFLFFIRITTNNSNLRFEIKTIYQYALG